MSREENIAAIALFAAFIVVLRFVPIIQFASGIPITAQSFGVMLAGTVLGARSGFLAVLLVLVLGLLGLPVFSTGAAGLAIFTSPTAGFLLGFPVAAFLTGLIVTRLQHVPLFLASVMGAFVGCVVFLYAAGILGFWILTDNALAASIGIMIVYIPGDLIKIVLAGLLTVMIYRLRPQWVLTR